MPYPQNVETARAVQDIVRDNGAIPATIAILKGRVHIGKGGSYWFILRFLLLTHGMGSGLDDDTLETLGKLGAEAQKTSRRDLASVVAQVHGYKSCYGDISFRVGRENRVQQRWQVP